jgi:hypothetical protein
MQWYDSTDSGSGMAGYNYQVYYNCSDSSKVPSSCTGYFVYPSLINNSELQAGTTSDGTYYWQVRAKDNAGNYSDWSSIGKVTIDTVAPITTDSGTDSDWHSTPVTVTLSCTDVNGSGCKNTYYTTDGSDPTTSSLSGNSITLSSDRVYTIKYFSIDNAGNVEDIKNAANTVEIATTTPETLNLTTTSDGGSGVSDGLGCANHDCSVHPLAQVLGISTAAKIWPEISYAGTNGGTNSGDEVLGASTSASPTPESSPTSGVSAQTSANQGFFNWLLTHKKIDLGILLIILAILYGLRQMTKKNK